MCMAKKAKLNTKSGKMWMEIQKGKTPTQAAKAVGIDPKNASHIMKTDNFQALEKSSYKEEILKHITMSQIAKEHIKVMTQDGDLGAKNTAIKLAIEKIEPQGTVHEEPEKVVVILK
jgi:hypothetical protein